VLPDHLERAGTPGGKVKRTPLGSTVKKKEKKNCEKGEKLGTQTCSSCGPEPKTLTRSKKDFRKKRTEKKRFEEQGKTWVEKSRRERKRFHPLGQGAKRHADAGVKRQIRAKKARTEKRGSHKKSRRGVKGTGQIRRPAPPVDKTAKNQIKKRGVKNPRVGRGEGEVIPENGTPDRLPNAAKRKTKEGRDTQEEEKTETPNDGSL